MPWVWSDELADALADAGVDEALVAALRRSPVAVAVPPRRDPARCAVGLCGGGAPDEARSAEEAVEEMGVVPNPG